MTDQSREGWKGCEHLLDDRYGLTCMIADVHSCTNCCIRCEGAKDCLDPDDHTEPCRPWPDCPYTIDLSEEATR